MNVHLEILATSGIFAPQKIEELDDKRLVPKMMLRRRLTRAGKIMIYLSDRCGFENGPIVYGSAFGELQATADIVGAIRDGVTISPTAFQNSVYNTAPSYCSILAENRHEILTLSSGDATSADVVATTALQALLHGGTVLMACTETLDIPGIDAVNRCSDYLEMGFACAVRATTRPPTVAVRAAAHPGFPPSVWAILDIIDACGENENPVVAVEL